MAEDSQGDRPVDVTIVIPFLNEENAVVPVIREVREAMREWPGTWEFLMFNDGSSDRSPELVAAENVRLVHHVEPCGEGACLKEGVRRARGRIVVLLDADGTYVPAHIPEMLSYFPAYDQVNGARTTEEGSLKPLRIPAKWFIRKTAEIISGKRIPDLNTGLKAFKRDVMLNYLWAVPDGFSNSASMTLAFLCSGHPTKYVPVRYRPRIGKSHFHPIRDTAKYATAVIRMMMYFDPLRIFIPLAALLAGVGFVKGMYDLFFRADMFRLAGTDVVTMIGGLLVLILGMLADLVVAQRRQYGPPADEAGDWRSFSS